MKGFSTKYTLGGMVCLGMSALYFALSPQAAAQQETPPCCRVEAAADSATSEQGGDQMPASCPMVGNGLESTMSCCAANTSVQGQSDASENSDTMNAPARGPRGRAGQGRQGAMAGRGMAGGGMKGARAVMQGAHTLVFNHGAIRREVTEIEGGVRTVTTTTDPALVETLRRHPREMADYLKNGGHVRAWDPLFRELSAVAGRVHMEFRDIENGIEVTSTSDDPEVVKLIRAHAVKVSEFVTRGQDAMVEATPLPEDYARPTD